MSDDRWYVQQTRANYRSMIPAAGPPDPVADVHDLRIPGEGPAREVPARLYVPQGASQRSLCPIVLFFHGGGFISGDLDTHDVLARALANRSGAMLASVAWRLAPEHPFPAGVDDARAALLWAADHAPEFGGDPRRISVAGDSAGGTIAAALAIAARDFRAPRIAAQLLLYPVLDHALDTPSWRRYGERYFPTRAISQRATRLYVPDGGSALSDPLVSPLRADPRGLPPTLVIAGGHDPLKDEGRAYAAKLRASGVEAEFTEYPAAEHGFVQFFKDKRSHPAGERALDQAASFLRERSGGAVDTTTSSSAS